MIKLDKWESHLIWLGKGWVDKKSLDLEEETNLEELLKILWGKRCGMYAEHVDVGFVAKALVELVKKVTPNFDFVTFLGNMAPAQYWAIKYTNNKEYNLRICWVCLYNYLSILQTNDIIDGEKIAIVELQPLDLDLFIEEDNENHTTY